MENQKEILELKIQSQKFWKLIYLKEAIQNENNEGKNWWAFK